MQRRHTYTDDTVKTAALWKSDEFTKNMQLSMTAEMPAIDISGYHCAKRRETPCVLAGPTVGVHVCCRPKSVIPCAPHRVSFRECAEEALLPRCRNAYEVSVGLHLLKHVKVLLAQHFGSIGTKLALGTTVAVSVFVVENCLLVSKPARSSFAAHCQESWLSRNPSVARIAR